MNASIFRCSVKIQKFKNVLVTKFFSATLVSLCEIIIFKQIM